MRSPSFACVTPYGYNRWCGSDPTPLAGQKAVRRLLEGAGSLLSSAPLFGLALDDGLHEPRVGRLALRVQRVHLLAELRFPLRVPVRETRPRAGPKHVLPRICRGKEGTGGSVLASADFLASAHDVRSARSPVGRGGAVSAPGRAPPRSRRRARARIRLTPRGAPGSRRGANPKSGVRSASCVSGRFADGGERFRGRTAQDGEFAQGVDVHLHAEPETAPDERGGGGHLDSRRRHSRGSMCAARHVGSAVRSAVSFYPDMIYR